MISFNYEYYCRVLIDEIFILYLRIEINKEVCYLYIFFVISEKQYGKIMLFTHCILYGIFLDLKNDILLVSSSSLLIIITT